MNQVSFGETDVKLDSLTLIFSGVVHFRLVHMGSRWGSSRTGGQWFAHYPLSQRCTES